MCILEMRLELVQEVDPAMYLSEGGQDSPM